MSLKVFVDSIHPFLEVAIKADTFDSMIDIFGECRSDKSENKKRFSGDIHL